MVQLERKQKLCIRNDTIKIGLYTIRRKVNGPECVAIVVSVTE